MDSAPSISTVRQLSPEKADAILRGAMEEFLAQGYAATSMDRIARAAGVSKATVYSHFSDKESLFEALTREMVDHHFAELFGSGEAAPPLPPEPRQALLVLATRMLAVHEREPAFLSFLRLVTGESERFPALAKGFVGQIHQTAFRNVSELFARCGSPSGTDPELMARVFIGALVHLVICQDLLHGKEDQPLDRGAFAAGLVDLLCPPVG